MNELLIFGLGVFTGSLATGAVIALLARGSRRARDADGGGNVYTCRACGAGPLEGEEEAREHALSHAAIDEMNWSEMVKVVG